MRDELSPLIRPENDDAKALRFDALLYGIELAYLAEKKYGRGRKDLLKKVSALAGISNIPEIMMQAVCNQMHCYFHPAFPGIHSNLGNAPGVSERKDVRNSNIFRMQTE